jgi:hypothetical protein
MVLHEATLSSVVPFFEVDPDTIKLIKYSQIVRGRRASMRKGSMLNESAQDDWLVTEDQLILVDLRASRNR